MSSQTQEPNTHETAVLGGGCFWCLEAAYQQISGVTTVVSGFAGGHVHHPTYEQVATGTTGHAEVVQLIFDPKIIPYPDVLDIFWAIHDPTTPGRQGYDVGPEYRSIILYATAEQQRQAEISKTAIAKLWPNPVLTEIVSLEHFWPADELEQNFYRKYPESAYCQIVINPKLEKLRAKFAARLKEKV
jgi:peptide-methionine (S)-S-oxide reductase